MSCYEWERGSIQIPSAAWAKFKADLRAAYNAGVQNDLRLAEQLVERVKVLIKGKRGVNLEQELSDEIHRTTESYSGFYSSVSVDKYAFKVFDSEEIMQKVLVGGKLYQPKKKDFPLANGNTDSFAADYDGCITLEDARRTVHWTVNENNHAVERAHESFMGGHFFRLLGEVKWTRGSGGHIYGSNEYQDDAAREYAGGGGSTISQTFGPEGQKAHESGYGNLSRTRRRASATTRR